MCRWLKSMEFLFQDCRDCVSIPVRLKEELTSDLGRRRIKLAKFPGGGLNVIQVRKKQIYNINDRMRIQLGDLLPFYPNINLKIMLTPWNWYEREKTEACVIVSDLQCGAGWTGALGDFGSFCYKEVFERKTWDNAHRTCKNLGGELFSVTNAYEQRFLENFTNIESWLGYRDKSRDGTWSWSDSSLSVFTNWDSSAKNDNGKGRDCVLLNSQEGKWKDASCAQTNEYLCKKTVDGK